jgi:hypothetical protein
MTEAGFNLRNVVLNKTRMMDDVQKRTSCSEVGTGLVEVVHYVCVCERERERECDAHILHIMSDYF